MTTNPTTAYLTELVRYLRVASQADAVSGQRRLDADRSARRSTVVGHAEESARADARSGS